MWRSFFGNMSDGLLQSPLEVKLRFLNRCISPNAAFRWARWPYHHGYAAKLDRTQRKMISNLLQIRPKPSEAYEDFSKRRRLFCGRQASKHGRWSHFWAESICSWNDHVMRNHDNKAWSTSLLHWHGESWLALQRQVASRGATDSRTGTRAVRSKVQKRWFEGAQAARLNG